MLTDERIAEVLGFGEHTTESTKTTLTAIARAIESEVRREDEALIRQMKGALADCLDDSQTVMGQYAQIYTERYRPHVLHEQECVIEAATAALAAASARLGEKT